MLQWGLVSNHITERQAKILRANLYLKQGDERRNEGRDLLLSLFTEQTPFGEQTAVGSPMNRARVALICDTVRQETANLMWRSLAKSALSPNGKKSEAPTDLRLLRSRGYAGLAMQLGMTDERRIAIAQWGVEYAPTDIPCLFTLATLCEQSHLYLDAIETAKQGMANTDDPATKAAFAAIERRAKIAQDRSPGRPLMKSRPNDPVQSDVSWRE